MDLVAIRIPLDVDPSNNPDLLRVNRVENIVKLAIVAVLKYHSNFSRAILGGPIVFRRLRIDVA